MIHGDAREAATAAKNMSKWPEFVIKKRHSTSEAKTVSVFTSEAADIAQDADAPRMLNRITFLFLAILSRTICPFSIP
jgi:hypothetical protein